MSPRSLERFCWRGYTLIEAMIVVALVSATVVLLPPLYAEITARMRLQSESHMLLTALSLARSEAIRRNTTVSVCPIYRDGAQKMRCGEGYHRGWMVFSNLDKDRELDSGSDVLLRQHAAYDHGIAVYNRAGTRVADQLLTYYPDGTARRNLTFLFCSASKKTSKNSAVVINSVGRARSARNLGKCPID